MRLWEIVLAVVVTIQFIWLWLPIANNTFLKRVTYGLTLTGIIAVAAHLVIEGNRWQMVPLYILFALFTVWLELRKNQDYSGLSRGGIFGRALLVLVLLLGVSLPPLFPIITMPDNPGNAAIGSVALHVIEEDRDEPHTLDPDDVREFMIEIWYPAVDDPSIEPNELIPETETSVSAIAQSLELPEFILSHFSLLRSNTKTGLEPIETNDGFPVLIFSHGLQSTRAQSTTLMESLASVGYVVVAIDHPFGGAITVYPDGRVDLYTNPISGEGEVYRRNALTEGAIWEADIVSTLKTLKAVQDGSIETPLEGSLDLDTLGLFGHSTGAGVVSQFCSNQEDVCDAVIGMDVWMGPVADEVFTAGTERPALFLMSETWPRRENVGRIIEYMDNSDDATWLLVKGTGHYDFADIPYLSPLAGRLGLSGEIDPDRGHHVIETYVIGFFDLHLRGESTTLFDRPQTEFPEIDYTRPVANRFPE